MGVISVTFIFYFFLPRANPANSLSRHLPTRVTFFNVLLYPHTSRRAASSQLNDTDDY